jgi:hypothetical protein
VCYACVCVPSCTFLPMKRRSRSGCAVTGDSPVLINGVTEVAQWCYNNVTVVLQWCYSGVTVVLQW